MKTKTAAEPKRHRIFDLPMAKLYPVYLQKVEKKGRTQADLDAVLCWLTGHTPKSLQNVLKRETNLEAFFQQAPGLNPKVDQITGTICGVRIEEIQDPLMRNIRYMDKLVDELAKGRALEKILRK